MRSSAFRSRFILAALLLVVTACQGSNPQAHTSPKPRASASPSPTADAARCARLAERHFTPCPPLASELKLPPTTIKNATDGAIDDPTAQKWARAFQLGQAYYFWAMEHSARDALTSGVLADTSATGNLFGEDLKELDQAKQEGGVFVLEPVVTPVTQVILVRQDLQDAARRQGLVAAPYGLAVRFAASPGDAIRYPDGREKSFQANPGGDVLLWGELRQDPDLGQIWYEYGSYGCENTKGACRL